MKRIICIVVSAIIVVLIPLNCYAGVDENIKAKSVVLMSLDTGEVLFAENEYEELSPASVTKMMSMLLIVEAINSKKIKLTDMVTVSENAASLGGSQIWLEVGEQMSVDDLLKAVIVASSNDACTALGEYVCGSSIAFVKAMNESASSLGLTHTNFENCTGLDDTTSSHYSCAYDLGVIACELMKYENLITKYSTIWLDSLRNGKTELNNTNKLINKYNGITGLKTGTTSNAGFCIAATATRDNMRLVAVVLGAESSEDRFSTATYLLDKGFAEYTAIKPTLDKSKITKTKVIGGKEKYITGTYDLPKKIIVKKGEDKLSYEYKIRKEIKAPVKKGQVIGKINIKFGDKIIKSIKVKCPNSVENVNFWFIFVNILRNV